MKASIMGSNSEQSMKEGRAKNLRLRRSNLKIIEDQLEISRYGSYKKGSRCLNVRVANNMSTFLSGPKLGKVA